MRLMRKTEVGKRRVYDIEVANDHNFYANGVNVHNCTGLQVPTIAVATAGGVSVIKNDGTVVNCADANPANHVHWDNRGGLWWDLNSVTSRYAAAPTTAGFTVVGYNHLGTGITPAFPIGNSVVTAQRQMGGSINAVSNANGVALLAYNQATDRSSLLAYITNTYNTGWMAGDIRRCWLSSNVAESITATELVTNGTFNTDISGWTVAGSGPGTWSVTGGAVSCAGQTSASNYITQSITCVIGKTYRLTGQVVSQGTNTCVLNVRLSATGATLATAFTSAAPGTYSVPFVATQTTHWVTLQEALGGTANSFDNISVQEVIADRSYKNQPLTINGTLAKTAVAAAAQLMFYSGWSATNYAQQAYSADLDFGTGAWRIGQWVNIPSVLTPAMFTQTGGTVITNGDFSGGTAGWAPFGSASFTVASGQATIQNTTTTPAGIQQNGVLTVGGWYLVTVDVIANSIGSGALILGATRKALSLGNGQQFILQCTTTGNFGLDTNSATNAASVTVDNISVIALKDAVCFDRSAATGAYYRAGMTPGGYLFVEAYDGTTTRRATSASAYNTGVSTECGFEYTTDGTLRVSVNGATVGIATGAPLLTLNNASAVTTIGNARTLDAAFPGSIALVRVGATVPTAEQKQFMYGQEQFMFQPNAVCTLPDAGAVVDMDYDPMMDRLKVVSAANESSWTGLVSTGVAAVSAGAFTKASHRSGVKLLARSTTNPGVDVSIPAYGLREELFNRAERAAKLARLEQPLDYSGGFTCSTTNGSTQITNIAGWVYPSTANPRGVPVAGAGIPGGAVITDISGTTGYISAPATATASGVQVTTTDMPLPAGYEGVRTRKNGIGVQYAAATLSKVFDGFVERERLTTNPAYSDWLQVDARRTA